MRELSFAHLPRHPSHFSASAPHAPPDFSLARWITAVSRLPFRELRLFKPTPVEKGGSPAQPLRRTVGSPAPFRLAGRGQIVKHGKLKWTRRHTRTPVILVRPVRARGPGPRGPPLLSPVPHLPAHRPRTHCQNSAFMWRSRPSAACAPPPGLRMALASALVPASAPASAQVPDSMWANEACRLCASAPTGPSSSVSISVARLVPVLQA